MIATVTVLHEVDNNYFYFLDCPTFTANGRPIKFPVTSTVLSTSLLEAVLKSNDVPVHSVVTTSEVMNAGYGPTVKMFKFTYAETEDEWLDWMDARREEFRNRPKKAFS